MLALGTLLLLLPTFALASKGHGVNQAGVQMKHRLLRSDERPASVPASPPSHELEERGLQKRYSSARLTYYSK